MKKNLLFCGLFLTTVSFVKAQDCSELFISEYVEGWSNNKALEIYNPTSSAIDLSQYMVIRYSNGATTATTANAVQLTGTIPAKGVHVGVIDKQDPNGTGQEAPIWDSLQVRADAFYCPDYNTSNAWYWNGNDAIVLAKGSINDIANSVLVDVFGKIGEDPDVGVVGPTDYTGWSTDFPYVGAGAVVTTDHSMIRKSNILKGVTNPAISFFDPLLEYDSIPAVVFDTILGYNVGNWNSLGSHSCDCETVGLVENQIKKSVTIYPNPSSDGIVHIKLTNHFNEVKVYNALAQEIVSLSNLNSVNTIDLGDQKGFFIINLIESNGLITSKRLIIK